MNKDSATIAQGESAADDHRMMGGPMLDACIDPVGIDPGVARLVAWARSRGFITTDSGDGRTKFAQGFTEDDGVLPYAHVAIHAYPDELIKEARRLRRLLAIEHGIIVESTPPEGPHPPQIEALYFVAGDSAMILLNHVDDSMLRPESCGS